MTLPVARALLASAKLRGVKVKSAPIRLAHMPLKVFGPVNDALADLPETGTIEGNCKQETTAIMSRFKLARKSEEARFKQATDSEYWCCVVFETRQQKEHFLRSLGILEHGDKYVDGRIMADALEIELPKADMKYNDATGRGFRKQNRTKRN